MTQDDKDARRKTFEALKPFARTLIAVIFQAAYSSWGIDGCYKQADVYLKHLERDIEGSKVDG